MADEPEDRQLVHLEADAVAERVEEALLERLARLLRALRRIAGGLEDLAASRRRPTAPVTPGRMSVDGALEGLLAEAVPLGELVGNVADDERARHVGAAGRLVVARPEVDHDRLARARSGPSPRWWPIADCGPCETMKTSHVAPCSRNACEIAVLIRSRRQRLAVDLEAASPFWRRAAQQVARGGHPGLGRGLRAADARELGAALHAAALVEEVAVGRELDARGAQLVGRAAAGRSPGTIACSMPSALDGAQRDLVDRSRASAVPLRRSSSAPNSSSGCSSNAEAVEPGISSELTTMCRRRRARRRGTGRRSRRGTSCRSSGERTVSA